MYGFSEDEDLLLFIDRLGLTRLSKPMQVETNTKIVGDGDASVATVSRDGSVAASYSQHKSVIWRLPELESRERIGQCAALIWLSIPRGPIACGPGSVV